MERLVRSFLSLVFILTTTVTPLTYAQLQNGEPLKAEPQSDLRGHTVEFDTVDNEGHAIHTTGAWVTLPQEKLFDSAVLSGVSNNSPSDPMPVYALESQRAEAENFRKDLATQKHIATSLVLINDEDFAFIDQARQARQVTAPKLAQNVLAKVNPFSSPPSLLARTFGSIQTAFQLGVSTVVFASLGLPEQAVVAAVMLRTLITANWSINTKNTDKFFNMGLDTEHHRERSIGINLLRRFLVDVGIAEVTRAVTGPYGHVHAVMTAAGQAEIWKTVVVSAAASYILLFTRLKTFPDEDEQFVNPVINFYNFFWASVLAIMDFTKHDLGPIKLSHVVWHMGSFEITTANCILIAGYTVESLLIHHFKPQVLDFARWNSKMIEKILEKASATLGQMRIKVQRCGQWLGEL